MTNFIENAVPIAEEARVTRRRAAELEAEALDLGLFIGTDWAGRPALSDRDARQLISGEARRIREHDAAWSQHLADCASWMTTRDAAVQTAYDEATVTRLSGPEADASARQAADEAGRAFERSTPVPLWQGEDSGNAVRRYSERPAPGLLARVGRRVKAGVR